MCSLIIEIFYIQNFSYLDSIFDLRKKIISLEKEKLSLITNGNEEVIWLHNKYKNLFLKHELCKLMNFTQFDIINKT